MGIDTEFHAYDGLPHGFGLGQGTAAEGWLNDAVRFWQKQAGITGIRQNIESQTKGDSIYGIDGMRRDNLQKGINVMKGKKMTKR